MDFTDEDKNFINDTLKEVYDFCGEIVSYYPFITNLTQGNPYLEEKTKTYGSAINLTCKVMFDPQEEEVSSVGTSRKITMIFKVPYRDMYDNSLHSTDINILLKGKMTYLGKTYRIVNVIPVSVVRDIPSFYHFVCREV